ncbi:MAG TPA: hypothetical protein VMN60_11590 [Longimicrobiales bacterium]|nr:hypothetical protein [Longimicrobiales bacterium]
MSLFMLVLQEAPDTTPRAGLLQRVLDFVDSPAPYSPFSEYLLLLFILWLLARRSRRKQTFDTQAQDVLNEKYESGEISKAAYDKFRQDVSLRPKR